MTTSPTVHLEDQISQWRNYVRRRQAIHATDVAELEDHLREHLNGLVAAGLAPDEAFLVAVKRVGNLDAISKEFAREHSDRLWKQLVLSSPDAAQADAASKQDVVLAVSMAVLAGVLIKLPELFGFKLDHDGGYYARNASLFVLPVLAAYFIWKRRIDVRMIVMIAAGMSLGAAFVNIYPFVIGGSTEALSAMHVPIALWFLVGMAYAGKRWSAVAGRMDFIRFTGELTIYYVLIAMGGGVLAAFVFAIFDAIGVDMNAFVAGWLIPCGAAGAVIIGAWLVEAKQSVIENMAPVLTRLFTPLFTVVLVVFLGTVAVTGQGIELGREILIAFDLLLVVVLGLLVYAISARPPQLKPGAFDVLQVVLLISAMLVDAVALWAIASRITEFGFTPNRVAALGENIILLVNLAWSAVLYVQFLRGRTAFAQLERWQTNYVTVFALWAALVVVFFPPIFGYK